MERSLNRSSQWSLNWLATERMLSQCSRFGRLSVDILYAGEHTGYEVTSYSEEEKKVDKNENVTEG